MRRIGGTLGVESLAALSGRERHRPQTRDEMRVAVHEMAARGMTDQTISTATGLSVEQVRRVLSELPA